jgi:hypothetical protein
MTANERPTVKTTNQARAGETGHRVRWVLALGIAAVAVAFAGLWLGWYG